MTKKRERLPECKYREMVVKSTVFVKAGCPYRIMRRGCMITVESVCRGCKAARKEGNYD